MNWKVKLVLLFAKFQKPIEPGGDMDIISFRRKAEMANRLGSFLFDTRIPIHTVINESADGVPIRIYKDSVAEGQRVIAFYHGGGFVLYGLDAVDNICRRLCKMNKVIVVSVDYRLAPEFPFPAAHEDAFTVIKWVRSNIEKYGGNPEKLILAGDSAGGNLSACMAIKCRKENIKVMAQVLIYPWIDGKLNNPSMTKNGEGYLLTRDTAFWFQKQFTPQKEDHCNPLVSPIYEDDLSNLAPAFILTAELDPLIDDGIAYHAKLKEAGNKVMFKEYKQLIHGFISMPGISKDAIGAFWDIRSFLGEL